ncbi:MAG: hypothetical protein KC680_00810 [Candidatus Peregrinibacteria bacterium]|nr:hypothetical protein [Candidatus Peregrinibacteria bacterium]MCB9808080.1 hypothetical protein [Candidatus Peribacteria bacterium]
MKTATSLTGLPQKKITTGLKRLQGAGITPERWLAMLDADPASMQNLADAWPVRLPSFSYDAVAILGFGEASTEPLPKPAPGEIVIRVGDWSLQDLRDCDTGKELMHQQDWYDKYDCMTAKLTPGVYRVRLPVRDSNRKNFSEQKGLLLSGEDVAPVALGAATLLVRLKETGNDLLENDWCRCSEVLPDGRHAALVVDEGRVLVYGYWDDYRNDGLWLSAARKA